ncbi:hypothetical protein JAAARDRAFT_56345 [Jaapia argillacea MUCL 33604]|uniref:Uncharacterized protein n=1 Tax=Jaapia argillacea MUCL 33604 TaxID=933084 RepID=A0A067Q048_9AGAM|nr:hypothetical protein JAAARDRAFT_56345 [Jaapia argillacea MUCL 33604]
MQIYTIADKTQRTITVFVSVTFLVSFLRYSKELTFSPLSVSEALSNRQFPPVSAYVIKQSDPRPGFQGVNFSSRDLYQRGWAKGHGRAG